MQTQNQIPLVNLKRQVEKLYPEFLKDFQALLEKTDFIGGASVTAFEQAFASYCQAQHCIGVGNGTDALNLIFKALELEPGDEVITPAMSFIATAETLNPLGLKVVFADIDPKTYTLNPDQVKSLITPRTKALLPVHLYGHPADLAGLSQLSKTHNLHLIEDAAQAHGSDYAGKRIGSWGTAAAFSFYPGKNLGAFGDAGGITTNDEALADKIRMIANHGRLSKYEHQMEGINSRLDTVQASVLLTKLQHLDAGNQCRQQIAKLYDSELSAIPELTLPEIGENRTHVYHLYVIKTAYRDELLNHLNQQGIQAGIHYPIPLHLQPAFSYLGYKKGEFPESEMLASQCLSLPICPELKEEEAMEIIATVQKFFNKKRSTP